jgi:hypothetical protein
LRDLEPDTRAWAQGESFPVKFIQDWFFAASAGLWGLLAQAALWFGAAETNVLLGQRSSAVKKRRSERYVEQAEELKPPSNVKPPRKRRC